MEFGRINNVDGNHLNPEDNLDANIAMNLVNQGSTSGRRLESDNVRAALIVVVAGDQEPLNTKETGKKIERREFISKQRIPNEKKKLKLVKPQPNLRQFEAPPNPYD